VARNSWKGGDKFMRGLADVRLLVLVGARGDPASEEVLDLLDGRTTAHRLPFSGRSIPVNVLRYLKRLVLGQDDAILLFKTGALAAMPLMLAARLFGLPTLNVSQTDNEEKMLKGIARMVGRKWPQARLSPLRIDLGCGSQVRQGFVGIDARKTPATAIVSDARAVAVASHVADEVYASCLLEHFENPHEVLREIHRVLRPDGQAVLRLPNLGTYSSHLDLTHRFLADLALWRGILSGYFEEVEVLPVGTKYRDSPSLVRVNWALVNLLKWFELAQGWDFICRRPKATPSIEYVAWWEE